MRQVRSVSDRLYQGGDGDDVFQTLVALLGHLVSKHPDSETWGLHRIKARPLEAEGTVPQSAGVHTRLAESAYRLETLLAEPEWAASPPLIFLKTFKSIEDMKVEERAKAQKAIMREIRVCSTEQPDLTHPNVCGISLATHAAAVEVELKGFGNVGLRGRLPFVALEYCNGLDLYDVFTHVWTLSKHLKHKLAKLVKDCPDVQPSESENEDVLRINQLLDAAAAYQGELCHLFKQLHKILAPAGVSLQQYVQAWSQKYGKDVSSHAEFVSGPTDVKAGRALRRMMELVRAGDWDSVFKFLDSLQLPVSEPAANVPDEKLEKLEDFAAKEFEVCNTMYRRLGVVLLRKKFFSHPAFNPRKEASYALIEALSINKSSTQRPEAQNRDDSPQFAVLKFENMLFGHILTFPQKNRLKLYGADPDHAAICPPNVSLDIFRQAAEAIAKLHASNIVHGDIKSENFVLTEAGQV